MTRHRQVRPPIGKHVFGEGTDCSTPGPQSPCTYTEFAGQKGTADADERKYSHVTRLGEVNEWTVHNGAGAVPHPLHIHVNHFQVVSFVPATNQTIEEWGVVPGDWRDTIPALYGMYVIKFKAHTFSGETVMHCHVLAHEDRGLMSTFLIKP